MLHRAISLLAFSTFSCASSVELSSAPQIKSSSDPSVVAQINEQVGGIAVDGERVYWVGSRPDPSGSGERTAIRSCQKDTCANTLVSYATENVVAYLGFSVQGGQVYWFQKDNSRTDIMYGNLPGWVLLNCPVSGCGLAATRRVASHALLSYPTASAFGPDAVYMIEDGQVLSFSLTGTEGTPEVLHTEPLQVAAMSVQGAYLYELVGDFGSSLPDGVLQRIRRQGGGPVQTLAHNLKLAFPDANYASQRLSVDSKYVYWTQGSLYGSIARCPISGCEGDPEVFVEPILSPTTVRLADGKLYWQHNTSARGFAVSGCWLDGCEPTSIAFGVDATAALAIDEQYFYTATTDQVLEPGVTSSDPWAGIRRFPK